MSEPRERDLRIEKVENRAQLNAFIRLPWSIYRGDPNWVPPLLMEQKQRLTKKNPFFQHASWQAWIALEGKRVVGRISAQVDQLHLDRYRDSTAYFGMLEGLDAPGVFSVLCSTAEKWCRERGMSRVIGPFNLSINEESGLLIDGFDTPPSIMMGHARPYYGHRLEEQGYSCAQNLLAYVIRPDFEPPPVMRRLIDRARRSVQVRSLRRKHLKHELQTLREIFNDAWSENWGFVPFTEAEFNDIGQMLALLVEDDYIQIAEMDGQAVAMTVALPNINEIIRDLNGRLLPFGWLKLLWRLKVSGYPGTARIPLMGVRKAFQHTRYGPALAFLVVDAAREAMNRRGIDNVELSWILETNAGVRNLIETCGGHITKRYRVYEKCL